MSSDTADSEMTKFPAFNSDGFAQACQANGGPFVSTSYATPISTSSATSPTPHTVRRNSNSRYVPDSTDFTQKVQNRPNRQKSLSEALSNIQMRKSSMSASAQELAEALKPPISAKLVILSSVWYLSSIASNMSSKSILNEFSYPITLTLIQFAFVCLWCVFLGSLAQAYPALGRVFPAIKNGVRAPSRMIVYATLPLTAFQIGGHILSSDATSRLPVSLVHTIKGLSPMFTVLFYRTFFGVQYNSYTYLSLIPLTVGVFLACSANFNSAGNILGLLSAFSSTILFVTQNIVSKQLFNEAAAAEKSTTAVPARLRKPDKLNLLCYSTGIAFIFTFPLWIWSEGKTQLSHLVSGTATGNDLFSQRLAFNFLFNGTFHFLQCLVAFTLLSLVSPVTYSVGSLIKRVFVILFAIVWFRNSFTNTQAFGIFLTFVGLYLYDRTSESRNMGSSSRRPKFPFSNGYTEPTLPTQEKPFAFDGSGSGRSAFFVQTGTNVHDASSYLPPLSHGSPKQFRSTPGSAISMTSTLVDEERDKRHEYGLHMEKMP